MKIITLSILFALTFITQANALDQQGLEELKRQGFQVRMGELTGAGSKMSLTRLAGFIHPSGIVMKADCKQIAVSSSSDYADPKVSDVTKVVVEQSVISAKEFEGFFTFE